LGVIVTHRFGTSVTAGDFRIPSDFRLISAFGVICFGLVGLELASIMGDEIRDPDRTLPGAVAIGGVISGLLYVGATLTLLIAVPKDQIGVLAGIMQAVSHLAGRIGVAWITSPFALVLSLSIAGIASAWLAGSARIPFVAGLDSYLPQGLGKLHPRYATPYVALIVHASLSAMFLAMSFVGAQVKEAFVTMLNLAVVLQLVPFLYMYGGLIKLGLAYDTHGHYSKSTLLIAGWSGLLTTALAMAVAFVPSHQIESVWLYEIKMVVGTLFFVALAAFFFFVYSRRKLPQEVATRA
jgi:amino acid transporter